MERINLNCENCHTVYDFKKTNELPKHVFFMRCNWCPKCEDDANDYYKEWWDKDDNNPNKTKSIPVGDNQLCMPFILDEIGVKHTKDIEAVV